MTTAPGITQWIPLPYGFLGQFLRDPLGYQLRARERFGDVFRSHIGPTLVHFLYHHDHVRRVLYDHPGQAIIPKAGLALRPSAPVRVVLSTSSRAAGASEP